MAGLLNKAIRGFAGAGADVALFELKNQAEQARQENLLRLKNQYDVANREDEQAFSAQEGAAAREHQTGLTQAQIDARREEGAADRQFSAGENEKARKFQSEMAVSKDDSRFMREAKLEAAKAANKAYEAQLANGVHPDTPEFRTIEQLTQSYFRAITTQGEADNDPFGLRAHIPSGDETRPANATGTVVRDTPKAAEATPAKAPPTPDVQARKTQPKEPAISSEEFRQRAGKAPKEAFSQAGERLKSVLTFGSRQEENRARMLSNRIDKIVAKMMRGDASKSDLEFLSRHTGKLSPDELATYRRLKK